MLLLLLLPPMSRPNRPGDFERGDDVASIVLRDKCVSDDFLPAESSDFFSVDDLDSQNRRFGFDVVRLEVLAPLQSSLNPRPIDSPCVSTGDAPGSTIFPSD